MSLEWANWGGPPRIDGWGIKHRGCKSLVSGLNLACLVVKIKTDVQIESCGGLDEEACGCWVCGDVNGRKAFQNVEFL